MPGKREERVSQRARGGRDVSTAGRDQTIITAGDYAVVNIGGAGTNDAEMPGLLPRDVPGFTGRDDELARLAGLAGGGRVVVSAIGGTAGVGKTALAVHAAHRLLSEFPDGHLYADLRGYTEGQDPAEPGEVLQVFLRRLGVPAEQVPAKVDERSGLLRQVLADRRVLMVLDNARTEAQVRPLLPGAGGSLVLVTSRSVLPGLEADERVSLDVLTDDEAVAMLAGVVGAGRAAAEPGAVAQLAGLCGRLPLALRIAGQMLATHPAWPVARLVETLAGERDRLARLGAGDLQVRAAFAVSYGLLTEGDARVFRLLGLHPGPDFTAAAAAGLAGIDPEEAGQVLDHLAEAYLVTEHAAGRFGIHDLLRLFVRATCQDTDDEVDREAAEAQLVGYYVALAEFLDSCVDPRQRPAMEQTGVPLPSMREALALFGAERRSLLAVIGLAVQRGWDEQVWSLSEGLGESLTVLRYFGDLLTIGEAALAAARHAGDSSAEGRALGNLGQTYRELRRFEEAITCHQQALAILRETGDRRDEGMILNNLGETYRELGQFEEAITCYQQDIAICRETGDRLGEGQTLNNLGIAYTELRRFEEAITCYQQTLAILRETGDRRGEGRALNNLGMVNRELRRFEEAITCYQQDIAICRETGDRYGEGETLDNLGIAYSELEQLDRAAICWRAAAAAMRDAGDHEQAGRLEQLASSAPARRRRWWPRGSRTV